MIIIIYIFIMQINYNDQQKKALNLFLTKSLSDNQILKKELIQKQRKYNELLTDTDHKIKQLIQQNQLLQEQLIQTKQRFKNLKRQQSIFQKITEVTSNQLQQLQQSTSFCQNQCLNESGQSTNSKFKDQKIKQQKIKYEQILKIERQKNSDCLRQINILTDYINLKQVSTAQKIKKLQEVIKQKHEQLLKKQKQIQTFNHTIFDDKNNRTSTQSTQRQNANKSIDLIQKLKTCQKQRKALENKLQICSNCVKQMEEFYTKQIKIITQKYNQLKKKCYNNSECQQYEKKIYFYEQKIKEFQIERDQLQKKYRNTAKNLEEIKKNFDFLSQKYNRIQNQKSQGEVQQFKRLQFMQKNYENILQSVQQQYQQKIQQYEQKIQLLMTKLDQNNIGSNEFKNITIKPRFSNRNDKNSLCESKLSSQKFSNESFRFTPGSSYSSSIKQSLARRSKHQELIKSIVQKNCKQNSESTYMNTKTPIKNLRSPLGIMFDRSNIQ